jgi:hypothetical protein
VVLQQSTVPRLTKRISGNLVMPSLKDFMTECEITVTKRSNGPSRDQHVGPTGLAVLNQGCCGK